MEIFPPDLAARAAVLIDTCMAAGVTLATAESCTGGLVAALLTEVAGSSAVFERGFVTYSNRAKTEVLGVPDVIVATHGAVSTACAIAMVEGALARSPATIAISVTGIAGPGGGSADKPVGLVHFAVLRRGGTVAHLERRYGERGRSAVRMASVAQALHLFEAALRT